jgi:hypothetical protein
MTIKFVGICGAPTSGKTTLADFLVKRYGAVLIDDGRCLREGGMAIHGMTQEDCYTQEGKARTRAVCGKTFTNRQLLGDLGNLLEGFYGEQFMPERGIAEARARADFGRVPFFVFASVRKTQGLTYRNEGGLMIEVVRPDTQIVNNFDRYDPSYVTHTLINGELTGSSTAGPRSFPEIEPISQEAFLAKAAELFDNLVQHGVLAGLPA